MPWPPTRLILTSPRTVAARVRGLAPGVPVELGFLEFMAPDLVTAGERLADAGCLAIDVVPLFLGAGGHVRKDLPALLDELRAAHPQVQWLLRRTVGEEQTVIDAMASCALQGPTDA